MIAYSAVRARLSSNVASINTIRHRARSVVVGAAFASAFSNYTLANDVSYYRGASWQVALVTESENRFDKVPYCEIRTVALEPMLIALRFLPSLEAGKFNFNVKLRKTGWSLPVGQTTTARIAQPGKLDPQKGMVMGPDPSFTAVSNNTLISDLSSLDEDWYLLQTESIFNRVFAPTKYRFPLTVEFPSGNEASWSVKPFERYEQGIANDAQRQCLSDLSKAIGLDGVNVAGGKPSSSTSPFSNQAGSAEAANPPAASLETQSEKSPKMTDTASNSWKFRSDEQDWGKTCYAETKVGDVKVGFMASPQKDLVVFVENLFDGDTKTTWQVDAGTAHPSEGSVDDYFGWHTFADLGDNFVEEVMTGSELVIADDKGKQLTVSLLGARQALPLFAYCAQRKIPG
ncbi:hypothetical protein ACIQUB_07880 [Rhizobium sp. NPDC090275]|uniref:hypothetical protein n=1 Tax=Rhizobium sp. NPDC090275 TaxID=3364498 RepID=UPI00383A5986